MLLDAQTNNQTAQYVLGEDFKLFCDNIIQELPQLSRKEKIMLEIGNNILYINILLTIKFLSQFATMLFDSSLFPIMTIRFSELVQILVIICVANFIVQFICKSAFQKFDKKKRWLILGGFTLTIVSVFMATTLFHSITIAVNIFVFAILILLLFIIQRYLNNTYE